MYVEMVCSCNASFSIEADEEDTEAAWSTWTLSWRFANAHIKCGFMVPGDAGDTEAETIIKKRMTKDSVEDEEDE